MTDGKTLCQWVWEGRPTDRWTQKTCPRRNPPRNKLDWPTWRHYLAMIGVNPSSKKWTVPLGNWIHPIPIRWKYCYSREEDVVLSRHGSLFVSYIRLGTKPLTRSPSGKFVYAGIWKNILPKDTSRADFKKNESKTRTPVTNSYHNTKNGTHQAYNIFKQAQQFEAC